MRVWDLATDPVLPTGYLTAHKTVVWFTGNSYPGPITPYENALTAFLDNGGRLFMNGQDILDQAAGHDGLRARLPAHRLGRHRGPERQGHGQRHRRRHPLTNGIGGDRRSTTACSGAEFEDQITPVGSRRRRSSRMTRPRPNALSVDTAAYKVVFLAFPFEAYGGASDQLDLMQRVMAFFGP